MIRALCPVCHTPQPLNPDGRVSGHRRKPNHRCYETGMAGWGRRVRAQDVCHSTDKPQEA